MCVLELNNIIWILRAIINYRIWKATPKKKSNLLTFLKMLNTNTYIFTNADNIKKT